MKEELIKKIEEYYCAYYEANYKMKFGDYVAGSILNNELKYILRIKRDIENITEYIPVTNE